MPVIHAPSSYANAAFVSSTSSVTESPDIWFDAVDHVEMDKDWFDAGQHADENADEMWFDARADNVDEAAPATDIVEEMIPFTEDCRRCIKELIRHLGEVQENELIFAGLSKILPRLPTDIMLTAHSLYVAVTERRNIDIAVLNTLGLACSHLLDDGNAISSMARYIRNTLHEYVGQSDWEKYLSQDDHPCAALFTGLAVLTIVARHWITDERAPQRRLLRVPAFLANLLLRANSHWRHLGRIAQHATKTCHFTLSNDSASHHYLCVEESMHAAPEKPTTTAQKSWLCTRIEPKPSPHMPEKRCKFYPHPGITQHKNGPAKTTKPVWQRNSAADRTASEVVQPLMLATASTVASTRYAGSASRIVRGAALTFVGTAALVGGKYIRDAWLTPRSAADHHTGPKPHALASATMADDNASAIVGDQATSLTIRQSTATPTLLCRNRLLGYLHAIHPFPSNETTDIQLAAAALRLLRQDEKYQAALAHISLYGTGLFGERHDEYLDPTAEDFLVGDLLAKLLFNHRSLERYMLDEFVAEPHISTMDFHKKLTGWSFQNEDIEIKNFFIDRFLFPMMPVLNLDFNNTDADDESRLVLVGSVSWFLMYMGCQFMWSSTNQKKSYDVEEMTLFGSYIFNMLTKGTLIEGSIQVLASGIKLAGLFLNPEWTPDTLPDLPKVQALVSNAVVNRIKENSRIVQQFDAVKNAVEKAAEAPWFSRKKMAEELLSTYCRDVNAKLFDLIENVNSIKNANPNEYIFKTITKKNKNSIDILLEHKGHAYCFNQYRQGIKIPTVNYRYRVAITDFIHALRTATIASLSQLFSNRDINRPDFSYGDFEFIQQAALTEVNVFIGRTRDIRERLAFGSLVETWKPKPECIFFNATRGEETRTYVINRTANDYLITKLNTHALLAELPPFFNSWPPNTLSTINAVFSTNHGSIEKKASEAVSIFIERLVDKKYLGAEELLYKAGFDLPFLDVAYEFLKDVFVPFYSCVTSLQKGDADNAVVSCVLDGAFTLGPFLKGGGKIIGKIVKSTSKKIMAQMVAAPDFIAGTKLTIKNTITFNDFIPQFNIYANGETFTAGKTVVSLIVDALDPGFSLLLNVKKVSSEFGTLFIRGNTLAALGHISKNWKNIVEASARVMSITDSRKVLVRVSRITNWGGDFDSEFNPTMRHLDINYQADASFLSMVYIDGGYYNIFRLDKTEIYFPASETGEVSSTGAKIYAMLSMNVPTGIFIKYVCSQPVSTVCMLSPWIPPEINASAIESKKIIGEDGSTRWVFEEAKQFSKSSVYPGHQCEIAQDGYTPSKLYEIVEIDDVHYIFDQHATSLRPLRAGEHAAIVPRRTENQTLSFERNLSGEIVISLVATTDTEAHASFSLDEKYRLTSADCVSTITLSQAKTLIAKIKDNCFPLHLAPIRNRFIIEPNSMMPPSIKVGWSAKEDALVFAKPYIGESSVHVGISLEDFFSQKKGHCEGHAIRRLPTELVSGAVWHQGHSWLKVLGLSYRLGEWREGLCPLYCHNEDRVAAWLRYDSFGESFDLVHDGADWQQAKFKERETAFEKLARKIFPKEKLFCIDQWRHLSDQNESKNLMLRLHQTAFLLRLNDANRMELLSLPAAHLRSWLLHADATPLLREYPALALGLSQFRQMTSSIDSITPNQLKLLYQIPLKNDVIGNYSLQGKIIPGGNGQHDAIWLNSESAPMYLKRYQYGFYGERITVDDEKTKWVPDTRCAPTVAVTQFMQEINFRPEPLTNILGNKIWLSHADWGMLALQRDDEKSKIDYVFVSPDGSWIGLIDKDEYLSVFSIRNVADSLHGEVEMTVRATSRLRLPIELRQFDLSLAIINNEGELYYPARFNWRKLPNNLPLWVAPLNFQPLFVTPDQRFFGFKHGDRSGVLIYDSHRQKGLFFRRPVSPYAWSALSAVAFSPLNAFVAMAFNDGQVFLYQLADGINNADRNPISNVALKKLFYVDDKGGAPSSQTIVMRFVGVFRYLTIIYDMGFFSLDKVFNSKIFVYDIFGFLPSESDDRSEDTATTPASTSMSPS